MIYLDSAATTPVRREVLEAMWPWLTQNFGNPSSHHTLGEQAAQTLKDARQRVASILGARASEITFTSGGTEADNLALKGIALGGTRGKHIITSSIEHEAVLASCDYLRRHHGFDITFLPVDSAGLISPAQLASAIRQHPEDTALISIQLANNEVGTIQPIAELAAIAHQHQIPLHTDAVQAAGQLDISVPTLQADAISLSGHKIGAPKGTGILFLHGRIPAEPVLHGGGQERGRRSGTENVAGAIAFATALELAEAERPQYAARLTRLRDRLIRGILAEVPGALLTGHPTRRLPNHASFCFPSTSGEAVLLQLEERGVLCSSGSACAAGSDEPSHVLVAMGIDPRVAQTAVRFTLSDTITAGQIDEVISKTKASVKATQALSA
jgi:cysteine desulfurase